MKKILLTGKNGQVGWQLQRTLSCLGQVHAFDKNELDLSNETEVREIISKIKPDYIINAAGYTAVDKAESEPKSASLINCRALEVMAKEAKKIDALIIHFSTDYVFDGRGTTPYTEEDKTNPINSYGASKLAGEEAIRSITDKYLIFRTSWVYDIRGKNFLLTMLKLAKERTSLKVVEDQIGSPTWARTIAETTAQALFSIIRQKDFNQYDTYNLTSSGHTSWKEFAECIFLYVQKFHNATFAVPQVIGIPSSEYPTPAERPKYSLLSTAKFTSVFDLRLPDWDTALQLCIQDLKL